VPLDVVEMPLDVVEMPLDVVEMPLDRLGDRGAQRLSTRPRDTTQSSDQRRCQPVREHRGALRHLDASRRGACRLHIPTGLTLRERILGHQRPHRVRRRAIGQPLDRAVHPNRVFVDDRSTAGYQTLEYHAKRGRTHK
jgi:hypothetical protein